MASLKQLVEEEKKRIRAAFEPIAATPRYSLLDVLASLAAADRYLTSTNLDKLEEQIFPDTASQDALREHWRYRVAPREPLAAVGQVLFTGKDGVTIPSGLLLEATGGQLFFVAESVTLLGGNVTADVQAQETGAGGNLSAGTELTIKSTIPVGVDATATVGPDGIGGGVSAETDEAYRARVISSERASVRTGKSGDFSAWALDSNAQVTAAWEFVNFDSRGAILVIVASGSQLSSIGAVTNVEEVKNYIGSVAPLQLVDVRSAQIVPVELTIALLAVEDTQGNRDLVTERIQRFWQASARPGGTYTDSELTAAVIDGVSITQATVSMAASPLEIDMYNLPTSGKITWRRL